MTTTPPTPEQINDLAQQIYAQRPATSPVPFNELAESLKVSLLRMAEAQLNAASQTT